ncbi:hypothetical protein B296_00009152 [Ensete ventricosum]|uniref:Uncharacterized protein n=1 Tax=Ensete ventricosum TaxID=4639 RepID=A0A427B555_ENSVE|nr:hypothetical protein B296_00009152 [Ensete ventricosum]
MKKSGCWRGASLSRWGGASRSRCEETNDCWRGASLSRSEEINGCWRVASLSHSECSCCEETSDYWRGSHGEATSGGRREKPAEEHPAGTEEWLVLRSRVLYLVVASMMNPAPIVVQPPPFLALDAGPRLGEKSLPFHA